MGFTDELEWFDPPESVHKEARVPTFWTSVAEVVVVFVCLSFFSMLLLIRLFPCGAWREDTVEVQLKHLEDALVLYEIKVGEPAPDVEVLTAWVTRVSPFLHERPRDPWGELLTFDPQSGCVGSTGADRTPGTADDLTRCPGARRGRNASIVPWRLPPPRSGDARSHQADRPSFKGL